MLFLHVKIQNTVIHITTVNPLSCVYQVCLFMFEGVCASCENLSILCLIPGKREEVHAALG